MIKVTLNGTPKSFSSATVTAIKVLGNDGNDKVTLNSALTKPSTLLGGSGNDSLSSTGGSYLPTHHNIGAR